MDHPVYIEFSSQKDHMYCKNFKFLFTIDVILIKVETNEMIKLKNVLELKYTNWVL